MLLATTFLGLFYWQAAAQGVVHEHHANHYHPTLHSIEAAAQQGIISRDEAILQKMYAGFKPEMLSDKFSNKTDLPIRCMTPVIQEFTRERQNLSAGTIAEIENFIAKPRSETASSYISPSENFIIYYETEGPDAVPPEKTIDPNVPDYVYQTAFAADSSYRYQVEELGFQDFLRNQQYEIFLENLSSGMYGFTSEAGGSSTFIKARNNFIDFAPNTHPDGNNLGALYVTIAHEIKHAIQYATNRWKGEAGNRSWSEMDATLMEEIVFPDVNDYYNYIMSFDPEQEDWKRDSPHNRSIFGNPAAPTPGLYWHVTWMLYFAETYDMEFWVNVWNLIRQDFLEKGPNEPAKEYISFLDAIETTLSERGSSLPLEHVTNLTWHLASGPEYSGLEFGFSDRENYPNPNFNRSLPTIPDSTEGFSLRSLAAHFVEVQPSNIALGQPKFSIESSTTGVGMGVVGYFRDGTTLQEFSVNPNSSTQSIQTTWDWSNLENISVAVVNTNKNEIANYQLTVDSTLPEEDLISQNYPNPFNPTTQIEFSLNSDKNVRIDVHDSVGRKISTLVDGQLNRGFHSVTFDGSGLASGVYFYRIITDQAVKTNKMMLIK